MVDEFGRDTTPRGSQRASGTTPSTSVGGWLVTQLIALVVCIGAPVAWTLIAPINFVFLSRDAGGTVGVTVRSCCLMVVPFSTQSLSPVHSLEQRHHRGKPRRRRRGEHQRPGRAEDVDGLVFLQVRPAEVPAGLRDGPDDLLAAVGAAAPSDEQDLPDHEASKEMAVDAKELEVAVSPVSIESRLAVAQEFLDQPASKSLTLVCVPNWKFSVIGGGFWTLLSLLYMVGVTLGTIQWCYRSVRRTTQGPSKWDEELATLESHS